jgi:t-SNARE complex subunit (syntaxin)
MLALDCFFWFCQRGERQQQAVAEATIHQSQWQEGRKAESGKNHTDKAAPRASRSWSLKVVVVVVVVVVIDFLKGTL